MYVVHLPAIRNVNLVQKQKKYCPDYSQAFCDIRLAHPLKLCNSCHKRPFCHFESTYYDGSKAHQQYRDTLVNSRNGFDLTSQELLQINDIVFPLVRRGQSVYQIVKTNQHCNASYSAFTFGSFSTLFLLSL